jgi:catechol 2,3-dioxygenase-like lactoylglutathione lyase family enzyme
LKPAGSKGVSVNRKAGLFREFHAVVVPVGQMARSRAFYEEVLGLEPRKTLDDFMTVYGLGGTAHLCLYAAEATRERPGYDGQGCFPNFRAEDIEAVHRQLTEQGVECSDIGGGGGVRWFRTRDPDGNRIDVCEFGPEWLE